MPNMFKNIWGSVKNAYTTAKDEYDQQEQDRLDNKRLAKKQSRLNLGSIELGKRRRTEEDDDVSAQTESIEIPKLKTTIKELEQDLEIKTKLLQSKDELIATLMAKLQENGIEYHPEEQADELPTPDKEQDEQNDHQEEEVEEEEELVKEKSNKAGISKADKPSLVESDD